jgi:IS1 family transposase
LEVAVCATLALPVSEAWGFAEEQTDPSGQANASTHHLYLTRALAVCAGMDYAEGVVDPVGVMDPVLHTVLPKAQAKEAEVIAFNDEMTDIGTICMKGGKPFAGNTDPSSCDSPETTWTNCTPGNIPDPAIIGDRKQCPAGASASNVAWEVFPIVANTPAGKGQGALANGAWQPKLGCFSQRFSPWSPLFHFPEEADLATLEKFAKGELPPGTQLEARRAYAYGPKGSNMWSAACFQRPVGPVPTGVVKPGTLEAFGMYLHSLGDYDSHRMCRDNWTAQDKPAWYFHTQGPAGKGVLNCGFNDHAFEFGCADTQRRAGFLAGTVNGAERVYSALLQLAAKQGKTPRISSVEANQQWLRRQLQRYVTSYRPSVLLGQNAPRISKVEQAASQCRVNFAWQLLQACVANAGAKPEACLPDVAVGNDVCPAAGQVGACPGGQKHFPVAAACGAAQKAK